MPSLRTGDDPRKKRLVGQIDSAAKRCGWLDDAVCRSVGRAGWGGVLEPVVLEVSWGEIALIVALAILVVATGRVTSFLRGVRRGMRDDDPGIRVRFIENDREGGEGGGKGLGSKRDG